MEAESEGFDAERAELFEALGHPTRIKILQVLDQNPMGFADLKKSVGITSSGQMAFHLRKLEHLVSLTEDGRYGLTGEGSEALRMIKTVRDKGEGKGLRTTSPVTVRTLWAVFLVVVVALSALAAAQQLQIANLSRPVEGTVELAGGSYTYVSLPLAAVYNQSTSVFLGGVNFTFSPSNEFILQVVANGTDAYFQGFTISVNGGNDNGTSAIQHFIVKLSGVHAVPHLLISFPDGFKETAGTYSTSGGSMMTFPPQSSQGVWYSAHSNPRVAVAIVDDIVTLYVSIGR